MSTKKTICIIGGGAAGIICACHLDPSKYDVHLYEKTSRLGRKLLVAGEGGFNLSFEEPLVDFQKKYHPEGFLDTALEHFNNQSLQAFLSDLGIETFVGSSNRIFPVKGIKPYIVVNKLLGKLANIGVTIETDMEWIGWKGEQHVFLQAGANIEKQFDIVIFALGGASWKKTGSDGSWLRLFLDKGIDTKKFEPSNCGWKVSWPPQIKTDVAGIPLKNITINVNGIVTKGEVVVTADGLEGGAIYAQARQIRTQISDKGKALIALDLKPSMDRMALVEKLEKRSKSIKHTLKNEIKLSPAAIVLLRHLVKKEDYENPVSLAQHIKSLQIETDESDHIDKAISTVGGLASTSIDSGFALVDLPKHYAIGEMLDWDTRTGGYLLQACFSQGALLAHMLNTKPQDS